ncbi:MAG: glutamine-synthetase adenylyltransferase, partial [Hyphomonas sp.]|nr:glutamine-synthetase adenylyltransferase [Hyphomonas sp.]
MLTIAPIADTPEAALQRALPAAPYLRRLYETGVRGHWRDALQAVREIPADLAEADAMAAMRQAKAQLHLSLAGEDLSGTLPVMGVTRALSEFAEECLEAALRVSLARRQLDGAGIFAVALGKMGAYELNYSSDIDICVFYDPDVFCAGDFSNGESAQRIARDLVRMMQEATGDGYVFRTDLRLRPDPSSTPLAVSTRMADLYYESVGQNWERMVWIKARPTAGDRACAERFLKVLTPFVWRRNLDYWAIGDIQAIKRMINSKVGSSGLETVCPDVKLGPGGIREIEFFAQTQQLILGGRQPDLRDNSTLGALSALTAAGVVEPATADALETAYLALRNLEHRVQMRRDEQTHTVPADTGDRGDVAMLCGYDDLARFDADLLATRRDVQAHYDALFAHEDRALEESPLGNLVFTGVDDDPGTIETLAALGFSDPSAAINTIRNWHRGRVPATRSARGRELLTALLPGLLAAMGKTGEPDTAFRWFSRFFEGLSSGVQTLSMLLAEETLLDDLVATLALAPRLAQILSRRPDLLEALVSRQEPPRPVIDGSFSFDGALDAWRRYHREQNFLIGHRLLHGLIQARDAGAHWSDLADETIEEMAAAAERETTDRYGPRPGTWAIFAMGKLGGRELTAGSD